jgi:transposase InsO family protein
MEYGGGATSGTRSGVNTLEESRQGINDSNVESGETSLRNIVLFDEAVVQDDDDDDDNDSFLDCSEVGPENVDMIDAHLLRQTALVRSPTFGEMNTPLPADIENPSKISKARIAGRGRDTIQWLDKQNKILSRPSDRVHGEVFSSSQVGLRSKDSKYDAFEEQRKRSTTPSRIGPKQQNESSCVTRWKEYDVRPVDKNDKSINRPRNLRKEDNILASSSDESDDACRTKRYSMRHSERPLQRNRGELAHKKQNKLVSDYERPTRMYRPNEEHETDISDESHYEDKSLTDNLLRTYITTDESDGQRQTINSANKHRPSIKINGPMQQTTKKSSERHRHPAGYENESLLYNRGGDRFRDCEPFDTRTENSRRPSILKNTSRPNDVSYYPVSTNKFDKLSRANKHSYKKEKSDKTSARPMSNELQTSNDSSTLNADSEDQMTNKLSEIKRNRKDWIKCDKYDGSVSLDIFLCQFYTCADYNGWNEADQLSQLKAALRGRAAQVLIGEPGSAMTLKELIDKLQHQFGTEGQSAQYRNQLRMRRRARGETLQQLYLDINRLVTLAHPGPKTALGDMLAVEAFVDSLDDDSLEVRVRDRFPKDLEMAFKIALQLESNQKDRHSSDTGRNKAREKTYDRHANYIGVEEASGCDESVSNLAKRVKQLEREADDHQKVQKDLRILREDYERLRNTDAEKGKKMYQLEQHCNELENKLKQSVMLPTASKYSINNQMSGTEAQRFPRPIDNCFKCNQSGHFSRMCPYGTSNGAARPAYSDRAAERPTARPFEDSLSRDIITCGNCGKRGHSTAVCRSRRPTESSPPDERPSGPRANGIGSKWDHVWEEPKEGGKTYLEMKIEGQKHDFLLDTGCEISIIPASFVTDCKLLPSNVKAYAANASEIPTLGKVLLHLQLDQYYIPTAMEVSPHVTEAMLGIDWLVKNDAQWDFQTSHIILKGKSFPLKIRPYAGQCCRVFAERQIDIPPLSEAIIPGYMAFSSLKGTTADWTTEPNTLKSGLRVARVVLPQRYTGIPIRVLNTSTHVINVKENEDLTECESTEVLNDSVFQNNGNAMPEHIKDLLEGIDKDVTQTEQERLRDILKQYADVFSSSEFDLGRTGIVKHEIDTGSARPIKQMLRRQPIAQLPHIDKQVQDMLDQGIIEPSQSPWVSNVVVVGKKDGTLRFCIDYRMLNNITRKDAYPLPRIGDCLDALGGAKYFSAFDLRSGYHQVEMAEKDKDKTSFVTRTGTYRYKVMSFGLCNAPATFQRIMDVVMAGLNFQVCLVYLDDIILFSKTVREHLDRLELLLQKLRSANLKLKPSKCKLLRTQVEFLGHIVSAEGIGTDPRKIEAVLDWPIPSNLTEVRSFLGLCSYYRRFVKSFSSIAAPLHALAGKNVPFIWSEQCQSSFEKLKQMLTCSPVLAMPADEGRYWLDTDASNSGIGAVLSQEQNGEERVIAYASRTLSGPEKNYCVTRKELLAVVFYAKHFRPYLLGRPFIIRTDHAALGWLKRTPQPIGQQARWLEILEEFDYTIEHRPGKRHNNADALSRKPCRQCQMEEVPAESRQLCMIQLTAGVADPEYEGPWNATQMSEIQLKDPEIGSFLKMFVSCKEQLPLSEIISHDKFTKAYYQQWDSMKLVNAVLYRRFESADGLTVRLQLVVPQVAREELILGAHTGATGGHLGVRRTQAQVQLRGYWVGWSDAVARYCSRCPECTQYHRGKPKRQGLLQPMMVGEPFERLAIDITGPHPKSRAGHVYILTAIDPFTKWAEAMPLRNHEAPTVARALLENVFSRFGIPMQLLSDRGSEFESRLMQELCRTLEVQKIRTTAYKPSTNGGLERFHRTLNSMLAKVVETNQRDWSERLPQVMAAYRASRHESTGYSPNMLTLGREVRAPVDILFGVPREEEIEWRSMNDFVDCKIQIMRESFQLVREQLGKAAEKSKKYYDLRVKSAEYSVNQWVWHYSPRRYVKRSPKWQRMYDGPYLVIRVINAVNYVIQKSPKSIPFVTHIDKLKPCLGNTPVSWLKFDGSADVIEPGITTETRERGRSRRPAVEVYSDEDDERIIRPRRNVGRPSRFDDFV